MSDIVRLENEYYVRASSALADDRTRVLKYGDTFAVFNRFGDIESLGQSQQGLFSRDCRYLSRFTMQLNGRRPLLLSSTISEDNAFLAVDLTNVDSPALDAHQVSRGSVHIFRMQFLFRSQFHSQVRLLNYGTVDLAVEVTLEFSSDFADIFEVRGTARSHRGVQWLDHLGHDSVGFAYRGLDDRVRCTKLEFTPPPFSLTASEARFHLTLCPNEEQSIFALVSCQRGDGAAFIPTTFPGAFAERKSEFSHNAERCYVTSSSENFNAWLTRSSSDLQMLTEGNPEGLYPYAGVPWYSTVFGRDGIITALECLWFAPSFAKGVLRFLADTQATVVDMDKDAEPGKIIHEMRRGEMAETREVPFGRYYGSIDSTPLFVVLAGAYLNRTGDLDFVRDIWSEVKLALEWLDVYGDADGDGFLEYARRSPDGLVQQGWKDSYDSVFHSTGALAEPPIALCEVQGYAFAAKQAGAALATAMGEPDLATGLTRQAEALRVRFEEAFWNEDLGSYVLALDGNKRQCCVRASNAGQVLYCGIASQRRAELLSTMLTGDSMFAGWGVRTLASGEPRYNPMSYHNGSIWPHDNALIAMGLSQYGMQDQACKILEGTYEASRHFELRRTPELYCGFHKRPEGSGPTWYPVACAPQAWAAGAVFLMIQACLGLQISVSSPQIRFVRPQLPDWLRELKIVDLAVQNGRADILLRRNREVVDLEVLKQENIDISVLSHC